MQVAGRAGVPSSGVSAVILSVSAIAATRATTLTVHPTGTTRPPTSSVEVPPILPADNLVVVPLGADGKVRVHNSAGSVHVAVDVFGWFPEDPPPTTGRWSFEPATVMLTSAGQTADVTLVHHDDAGAVTGASVPSGVTTTITDPDGVLTMTETSRGRYRLTATAAIGQATVDATVPGIAAPARLGVTTVQLQPAVQVIAADRVVFPPAAGVTTATGPFTIDEVLARTVMPSSAELQASADPFSLGAQLAVVLRGVAPPTGTVVIGGDGSSFAGRVIEPSGLPTLSRAGHVLITVAITRPMDVFRKLDAHAEEESELTAVTSASPLARRANAVASRLVDAEPSGPCTADAGSPGVELTTQPPSLNKRTWADANFDVDLQIAHLRIGYQITASVGFSLKLQNAVNPQITCVVKDFGAFDIGTGGPLDALVTVYFRPHVDLKFEVKIVAGARAELSASCSASTMRDFDIRWAGGAGFQVEKTETDPPAQCDPKAIVTGDAGNISPLSVEISGGLYLVIDVGVRFGGRIAKFFEDLTGEPVGEAKLLAVSLGIRMRVAWENEPVVLANKKSGSTAALEAVINAGVEIPILDSLLQYVTGDPSQKVSITLFEGVQPLLVFYRPPAAGPVYVNNQLAAGTITIKPGDQLTITEQLGWEGDEPAVPEARVESATAWLARPGVVSEFDPFTDFQLSTQAGPPASLTATGTVTRAMCDRLGTDTRTISFLANAPMFGVATNGFAGSIDVKCEAPSIAFDREVVDLDTTQVGAPVTVHLAGHNMSLADWTIAAPPVWLSVADRAGNFMSPEETDDVVLTVDCTKVTPRAQVSTTLIAEAFRPADTTRYEARLTVQADCRDKLIDFTPNVSTGDATVMLNSRGTDTTTWELSGTPTWAKISPSSGSLNPGTSQTPLTVDITQRKRTCGTLVERRATITATAPGRGTATLTIVDPQLTPSPTCGPTTTGGSGGDPHMQSMDGIRYDAQVLGEYTYLRPAAGASGATVHVRHDYTNSSAGFARPTSLIGVVVAVDGHSVEILARPSEVRIDGTTFDAAVGVPVSVSESLTMTQSVAGTYLIDAADLVVTVVGGLSATLNLWITAPIGAPYVGLLGAPDGSQANDLTPAGASTSFTRADVDRHAPSLYVLTDSWRLTDPATSLFTRPWDGFDAPNPPYNEAQLEPFKQQVIDHLQPLTGICDGDSTADSYVVRALAIELAIGSSSDVLDSLTCRYAITGRIISPAGDAVAGLPVTVDAPGLVSCTTTSTSAGAYGCMLTPDASELTTAPTFPLPVTVEARWPDDGSVAASTTTTFASKANFDVVSATTADLAVDDSTLPRVTIRGTLTGEGGGLPGPISLIVVGYAPGGGHTAHTTVQVTPDPVTGAYELSLVEPHGTTQLGLFAHIGVTQFTKQFDGIHPGVQDLEFSVDHRPTTLSISGTMLLSGVPFHGPMPVSIEAFGDSGQLVQVIDSQVAIDQTTGGYSLTRELPSTARSALITVLIGSRTDDWKRLAIPTLTPGLQLVTFDVDVHPTDLVLSGQLRYLGSPVDGFVLVSGYSGGSSFAADLLATGGQYSGTIRLPEQATEAHVVVTLTANFVTTEVTRDITLTAGTVNNVTWDIDVSSLMVQGTASVDGNPLVDALLPATLQLLGANDQPIGAATPIDLSTDEFGYYWFQVPMDSQVVTAELTVTFPGDEIRVYRLTGLHPGAMNRTLDIDPSFALSLTLRGQVLDDQGAPQQGLVDVNVAFIDVAGVVGDVVATSSADLDLDGSYTVSLPLPPGATHARVELAANGFDEDWVFVVPLTGSAQEQVFDIDRKAPRIQLVGNVLATDGCIPSRVEPRLILIAFPSEPVGSYDPITFDWPGGTRVYDSFVIVDPVTGLYGVAAALPADTTRVVVIQVDDNFDFVSNATLTIDPRYVQTFGWDLLVC
ncbi:MAG TPA: hypothetical protein VH761_11870 [Ilumatobacteraceae bacterium]